MKKFVSVLLAVILVFSGCITAFAGHKESAKLKFNENGEFKILVLADVQTGYPMDEDMVYFIEEALKHENPDLVVFTGDNVNNPDLKTYEQMLKPLIDVGVPYTMVLGNHDQENSGGLTREQIVAEYQKYEGFLGYDADPSIHGAGTHNLPILSSDGKDLAFNLWLFDCGDYVYNSHGERLGYDWVRKDQIEWYDNVREELKAENGGEVVPSLVFQHIIPQEPCREIFYVTDVQLGEVTKNFSDGTAMTFIPDISKYNGYLFEPCCPGYGNDGQWDAMVNGGDVLGVVCGHDHMNSFIADVNGIDMIMTPGCTYDSYNSNINQGARVLVLNEKDTSSYETYLVTSNALAMDSESNLGNNGDNEDNRTNYTLMYYFEKIFDYFYSIFRNILGMNVA